MLKTISVLLILSSCILTAQVPVTFRVDMEVPVRTGLFAIREGDAVLLAGTFNNWEGSDHILSDPDGDSIYTGTFEIDFAGGTEPQYKFQIRKADGKIIWEKKPDPDNPNHGCRRLEWDNVLENLPVVEFDHDRYFLATIGKEVVFSKAELEEDFEVFRRTLESRHCCLYEYTDKPLLDALFEQQQNLIDTVMKPNEFFKLLTPVTARIGCGHTAVWMPGGYWDIEPNGLFPLRIKLVEDKVVVIGQYGNKAQPPFGSIIQAINHIPVGVIIDELRINYSADAFNPYFIDSQIERRFSLLYARRFGLPITFMVNYFQPGSTGPEVVELNGCNVQSVKSVVFENFDHPELVLDIIDSRNTAIMKIKTFIYYDRVSYFENFLDSSFAEIKDKEIGNLILDLRGNDGGDPFCAAPLFSYLQPHPLPYFSEPYGKYADLSKPLPMPENSFDGNLYILIDGRCFSTNGHFCALLDYHGIGKFIGTPGGSTYKCNAGKNTMETLPNTLIMLYLGTQTYAAAVEDMDKTRPIMPDYPVIETHEDILNNRDIYLDRAFEIIQWMD